jgi:hypothetical protein
MTCEQWRQSEKIDELPMYGAPDAPFLCNLRGYNCRADTNVDINHDKTPAEFKKFFTCMGGFCFHKLDKDGYPLLVRFLSFRLHFQGNRMFSTFLINCLD